MNQIMKTFLSAVLLSMVCVTNAVRKKVLQAAALFAAAGGGRLKTRLYKPLIRPIQRILLIVS